MSLIVKKKAGSNIPPLDGGVYPGICIGVVDIGEQQSAKFKKYQDKVILIFEVIDEFVTVEEDGQQVQKPRWLSREYTKSLDKKSNLMQTLRAWFNLPADIDMEAFDMTELVCAGCQLSVEMVERDDKRYNNIGAIIGLPKGMKLGNPISVTFIYDMDAPDDEVFVKLPSWIQDKITGSTQHAATTANSKPIDIDTADVAGVKVDITTGEVIKGTGGPGF